MDKKQTVLVADNDVMNLNITGNLLEAIGYKSISAGTAEALHGCLKDQIPDLILLGASLRCPDGSLVISKLKSNIRYSNIPVVLMVSDADFSISGVYEQGASDYVSVPVNKAELAARLKAQIELKTYYDTLSRLSVSVSRAYSELEIATSVINSSNKGFNDFINELDNASKTDFLTGLYNRRYMLDRINDEAVRARSTGRPFALLLGDLDHFKKVNDTYGHDCGDEVLKSVSRTFKDCVRGHDYVARWGGEEFLFLVVEMSPAAAMDFGERLRLAIASSPVYYNDICIEITITIGISLFKNGNDTAEDVIKRADSALYAGKNGGRNRVVVN